MIFGAPLSANFLKIAFLHKKGAMFYYCVVSYFCFFGLLKNYKNRGFSICWFFLLLQEKKEAKKKTITGISEFGFFCPKMAVS